MPEEKIILDFLNWCEANNFDVLQFTEGKQGITS
jgi:hypothetical protein